MFFKKNISATFGLIAIKFGRHIHVPLRMNCNNFEWLFISLIKQLLSPIYGLQKQHGLWNENPSYLLYGFIYVYIYYVVTLIVRNANLQRCSTSVSWLSVPDMGSILVFSFSLKFFFGGGGVLYSILRSKNRGCHCTDCKVHSGKFVMDLTLVWVN